MDFTEEQRKRIEANRQTALSRLAAKRTNGSRDVDKTSEQIGARGDKLAPGRDRQSPSPKRLNVDKGEECNKPDHRSVTKNVVSRLESLGIVAVEGGPVEAFRGLAGTYFKNGMWHVPLRSYRDLLGRIRPDSGVPVNIIDLLIDAQSTAVSSPPPLQGTIPEELGKQLFPFQRDGVQWAIGKRGRVILADEMGLGKTIQAIAIASYYRLEWPLLILAPASMVASWHEQVIRWLNIDKDLVGVVYDGKAKVDRSHVITIISYDLAVRLADQLKALKPGVVIADESHCLRNGTTKRVRTLKPIIKAVGRTILLSGTPALSRPVELFEQLAIVSPGLFPKLADYGLRYCAGRRDRFGWNFRGHSHLSELSIILEATIMLRRRKKEVLSQLPGKIRQQVFVRVPEGKLKELRELSDAMLTAEWATLNGLQEAQRKGELMALWRQTGEAKMPAMWAYISDLLDIDGSDEEDVVNIGDDEDDDVDQTGIKQRKLLIFAHHQVILDGLEERLVKANIGLIRIDGQSPPSTRQDLCNSFQTDRRIRVAILSITAASVGLTLTAATLVLFCELFFNPGILVQAEDRAHRIGQTDCVTVQYLLARGTMDDRLWPLLIGKLNTLESVGLGENDFSGMVQVEHDERQLRMDRFLT